MMWIAIGTVMVSLALSYAWWTRVRVINFRQDVFDIRDELFDRAMELGALDDGAYKAARNHLNSAANTMEMVTVWGVAYYVRHVGVVTTAKEMATKNAPLQEAICNAMEALAVRLTRYLVGETLAGRLVTLRVSQKRVLLWARRWVQSEEADRVPDVDPNSSPSGPAIC